MSQFFVDSHCHLDDSRFDPDREEVIARAQAAGVKFLLAISGGDTPDELSSSLALAELHEGIYAAVGIHPHEARRAEPRHFDLLQAAAAAPKVLAVGEIGLDYYYEHSPREMQKEVLIHQLEIARAVKRPVVVHCRDAWQDLAEIVERQGRASGLGGILHCFTGTRQEAFRFLDWGFLVSFAGNITFKKAEELRAIAREIPLDRLLTETDSPYLAPVPHRGKRNEPAFVVETAKVLAEARGISFDEIARQTTENFFRLFNKVPRTLANAA